MYDLFGNVIEIDCDTYDNCYNLLCSYQFQPTLSIIIKPNTYDKNCDQLNINDTRPLSAEIDYYNGDKIIGWTVATDVSDTSLILCEMNKNTSITEIEYWIDFC